MVHSAQAYGQYLVSLPVVLAFEEEVRERLPMLGQETHREATFILRLRTRFRRAFSPVDNDFLIRVRCRRS
jgi:hypothetical protein